MHLLAFQQYRIHSKEFGRRKKFSYSLLSILNRAGQSMRIIHMIIKVVNPMESSRLYALFCEDLNTYDKVMCSPEVCLLSKGKIFG